jgi:hypothetical protein
VPLQKKRHDRKNFIQVVKKNHSLWPTFGKNEEDVANGRFKTLMDTILHENLKERRVMRISAHLMG